MGCRCNTFVGLKKPTMFVFVKAVRKGWKEDQEQLIESVEDGEIHVAGDGRHSTVGHRALYCSYSIQDSSYYEDSQYWADTDKF